MAADESHDWLELQSTPIDVAKAAAFVSHSAAGGIDIFLGSTRAEGTLLALDYQAYESMARRQLSNLATTARTRWPVKRLVILHRLGRVSIGEASVLIAVSTAHRAEAFECCRWIIDELKRAVVIWKKEIWAQGEPTWVEGV